MKMASSNKRNHVPKLQRNENVTTGSDKKTGKVLNRPLPLCRTMGKKKQIIKNAPVSHSNLQEIV